MGIAITLAQYLAERGVKYDVVEHPHAVTASESAKTSHISLNRLAKAVVLKGKDGFLLAVLPASGHIQFRQLCKQLGADVDMASEEQIETLFLDCEPGAVPALGAAHMGLRSSSTTAWQTSRKFILRAAITPAWFISAGARFRSFSLMPSMRGSPNLHRRRPGRRRG